MQKHLILGEHNLSSDQFESEIAAVFGSTEEWLPPENQEFKENRLLKGRVVRVTGESVWVDVGHKSEGVISLREWLDDNSRQIVPPRPGDEVHLLLQSLEDDSGAVVLSYRKARAHADWQTFLAAHHEGDVVSGQVTRKVKGGLLVLVSAGVHAFLPASQVDLRRSRDPGEYLGRQVECKILEVDRARRTLVVSRRQVLEEQRDRLKKQLLAEIAPGQIRQGIVKNITSFGAFVDLGGIDGLLHLNEMSWARVHDAHDVVRLDEELQVYVLRVQGEQVALSLKPLTPSPWQQAAEKFPVGSDHDGVVANVTTFGAFVTLAPGLEGLVHVSQMARGRRQVPPTELLQRGDRVRCVVLAVDQERRRLSLGFTSDGEHVTLRRQ